MNTRNFLGDEKISSLMQQGYSPEQIRDYARTEYYKQQGAQWANLAPQQEAAVSQKNVVLRAVPQQGENTDWAAQGYRPVPIRDEQTGEVVNSAPKLGLDGRPIPAAPTLGRSEEARANDKKSKFLGGALDGLGMEAKTILANSFFGSGEPAKSKDEILQDKVAKASSRSLFQTIAGDEKDTAELQKDLDYIAKNAGYELGAVQTSDGKIYFGTRGANGQIIQKEVTPSLWDDLAARKTEIAGGVVGAGLAPFTGGASLVPMLAMSAGGSAIGSMNDLRQKGEAVGKEYSAGDYAARALQAAGEDALGGVAVAGAGKLIKATAPAIKQAGGKVIEPVMEYGGKAVDLAKKATDWGGIGIAKESLKGLPMANAGGAKRAISAIVGDEADEILKNAEKLGGYKVDNNNFTDLQILNKPINFIKDHLANTAGKLKLDKASDFLNNAQGVNKVQREIVDFALGDNKATSNVINALQGDKTGQAARNLAALAQSDVNAVRKILPKTAKGEISRDVSNFYARVSDDFGKMEEGIAQSLGGKTTTLSSEAIQNAKEAMVKNLNAFELKTPEAKTLLGALENLKDKPMDFSQLRKIKKDFNEYAQRIFNKDGHYGQKVDTSAVGKIIDDAVDRLIEGTPNAKYLKSELAKYSDMSKIKGNPFFEKIIDPNSSADDVLSAIFNADKAQGDILDKFSRQLNPAELEKFETDLLGELFNSQIAKRGTRNITEVLDGIGLRENLQKINLKSEAGKDLKDAMLQLANARGNLVDVFAAVDKNFIKPTMPRAGIAQTPEGLLKSILINRLKQSVFKYVGKVGNDAALDYHLREGLKALKVNEGLSSFMQAVKNSGASDEVAEGIAKAVIDQGREIAAKKESSLFKATADAENGERLAFSGYKPDAQRVPSLNNPIIPQNSQKVKELSPAELRKAIINAKDDKERLAIIENQKAGIRQNIDTKAIIDASPQSGRDMALIGRENLNGDIVKYILESKKTIAVDKLDIQRARELKFKHPQDVRRTIGSDAIIHVMNRHGANSILVKKSGQRAVSLDDIAKWQEYADNADLRAISKDNSGQEVVVNGKQINGYYVVVEEIKKKKNELAFKTMYFEKGRLKNNEFFKNLALGTDNKSALTHSGYEPEVKLDPINARSHSDIIPQNLKNASIGEWQREISKVKDDWSGLKRLMDQIQYSTGLKKNERANLYVDISERMKKIGK